MSARDALSIAPAREDAQPRSSASATLRHLHGPQPLEEYNRLNAEITDDLARLTAKIATKNVLELHLRLSGQL